MTDLKMYMIHDVGGAEFGASLVFAHNAAEAKKVGRFAECVDYSEYINIRVRRIKSDPPHLLACADVGKFERSEAHYEEMNLPCCEGCEMWGEHIVPDETGYCEDCKDARGVD